MRFGTRRSPLLGALIPLIFLSLPAAAGPPVEVQKLLADDGAKEDWFGNSVAVDGDTAIIGANSADDGDLRNVGAAYIFVRTGDSWDLQAKLLASDRASNDVFGSAVAIDGNIAVIGAYGKDDGEVISNGAAYVFIRVGDTWYEQAKLELSDKASLDYFGRAVAIDDGTIVVSAPRKGAAYVFTRAGHEWIHNDRWVQQAKLGRGGGSVAIDGDTVLVGGSGEGWGSTYRSGAAYVFVRNGTVWTQQARLLASDRAKYDAFGSSVAVDGDTAVIGASRESDSGISENGAAYIFNRTGTAWVEQAKLLAGDKGRIHHFGRSVGIDGDTALIGAMGQTDTGTYRNGAAYVFANMEGKWDEQAKLLASDKATENWFGEAVAIDGQTAVIGARLNSDNAIMSGSAYVFDLSPPIVVINDLMTLQPDPSSYSITPNTAGCPPGYNAKFHFEAQLGNSSQLALSDIYIQVAVLRNDNALLTSAGGAFGAGIVVPVPEADGYADELLAPAEYVDVPFTICLRRKSPFRFVLDVLGQHWTSD